MIEMIFHVDDGKIIVTKKIIIKKLVRVTVQHVLTEAWRKCLLSANSGSI